VEEELFVREFDNGLTVVAQRMSQASSAAMTIALPAGASRDPTPLAGSAAVGTHWLLRGAGDRSSRQLNEALDGLGCQHHEEVRSAHVLLSAAQLGRNLPGTLAVYSDIVRRPLLGDETLDPCRALVSQTLDGLEDEPMRQCNLLIREKFYPFPLGRNPYGNKASLSAMEPGAVRSHLRRHLTPQGTIVSVAGHFDWSELVDMLEQHFGDWQGTDLGDVQLSPPEAGTTHISKPTAQAQIALAYPAAVVKHEQYYAGRVAEMILGGGMSARLFTEVREKRGLVYAVVARYHALKEFAGIFTYAGTTPQRARETLAVTIGELRRLGEDLNEKELARAKTQLKSALVMQGESTTARAQALAADWYHLGRLRTLSEISAAIDAVTLASVRAYVDAYPATNLTVLTIGPDKLNTSTEA